MFISISPNLAANTLWEAKKNWEEPAHHQGLPVLWLNSQIPPCSSATISCDFSGTKTGFSGSTCITGTLQALYTFGGVGGGKGWWGRGLYPPDPPGKHIHNHWKIFIMLYAEHKQLIFVVLHQFINEIDWKQAYQCILPDYKSKTSLPPINHFSQVIFRA